MHYDPYGPRKPSVDPDLASERTRNCYSVEALDLAVPYLMGHMDHMGPKNSTVNTPNDLTLIQSLFSCKTTLRAMFLVLQQQSLQRETYISYIDHSTLRISIQLSRFEIS